jgi:hypothetical protein
MSFTAEILAHTALFMAFLTAFYFGYVANAQVQSTVQEVFSFLKPELSTIVLTLNPNNIQQIKNSIITASSNAKDTPFYDDTQSSARNKKLILILGLIVGLLSPLLLGIAIYLEWSSGGNLTEFLLSNCIVMMFIIISEFAIVGMFLTRFTQLDPNFIKATLVDQLQPGGANCNYTTPFLEKFIPASWIRFFSFR